MSSADLARAGSEAEPVLNFGHWPAVRRAALALYFVGLIVWSYHYGIPVQRDLVIAWVCGALACACIGRHPREMLQLVIDWAPMVIVLGAYDITRGAADKLGIGVHFHPMIDFDKAVFFGQTPTEWLQHHLYNPHVVSGWNVFFTLTYTSYFLTPFVLAGWLWAHDRREYLRFAKRLVSLAIAGVITYILFPGRAALDGRQRRPPPRRRPDHRGRVEDHRRRHLGPLLRRPGLGQPGRRGALAALGLHDAGRALPLGPRAVALGPPAAAALSGGDGR